jgi:flagellar biosynthesis component FlhA
LGRAAEASPLPPSIFEKDESTMKKLLALLVVAGFLGLTTGCPPAASTKKAEVKKDTTKTEKTEHKDDKGNTTKTEKKEEKTEHKDGAKTEKKEEKTEKKDEKGNKTEKKETKTDKKDTK